MVYLNAKKYAKLARNVLKNLSIYKISLSEILTFNFLRLKNKIFKFKNL